jgi:hypothetical protein
MLLIYPVCVLAALVMMIWLPVAIIVGSVRSVRIMLASDRLANAVFGGSDRETISSRSYRGQREGVRGWCLLCRLLDLVQKDHCRKADGI